MQIDKNSNISSPHTIHSQNHSSVSSPLSLPLPLLTSPSPLDPECPLTEESQMDIQETPLDNNEPHDDSVHDTSLSPLFVSCTNVPVKRAVVSVLEHVSASQESLDSNKKTRRTVNSNTTGVAFRLGNYAVFDYLCCRFILDFSFLGFECFKLDPQRLTRLYTPLSEHPSTATSLFIQSNQPSATCHDGIKLSSPLLSEKDIKQSKKTTHLLRKYVIKESRLSDAVESFLQLVQHYDDTRSIWHDYIDFISKPENKGEKLQLIEHMERYLRIFSPDSGFEVVRSHRYSSKKQEACLVAKRHFKPSEKLYCCTGILVPLTDEEEEYLGNDERLDFSIMHSARNQSMALFMGPCRFINHDCSPNVEFFPYKSSTGIDTLIFRTIRDIYPGDEINVSYGPHYFGENNKECLCQSCEAQGRGGFCIRVPDVRKAAFKQIVKTYQNLEQTPKSVPRDPSVQYCSDCRTEINPKSIFTNAKEFLVRGKHLYGVLCTRCYRHRILYRAPWPNSINPEESKKAPQIKKRPKDSESAQSSSSEVSVKRKARVSKSSSSSSVNTPIIE